MNEQPARDTLATVTGGIRSVRDYARENEHSIPCERIAHALDALIELAYKQLPHLRPEEAAPPSKPAPEQAKPKRAGSRSS